MIKSFVLAATSIAYILSIANIVDAKVQKSDQKIYREQSCLSQTAQSTQAYNISTADIRGICQSLTNHYTGLNKYGVAKQESCIRTSCSNRNDSEFRAFEVNKIELISYHNKDQAMIRIEHINRLYEWVDRNWVLTKKHLAISEVQFFKKDDKWTYKDSDFRY